MPLVKPFELTVATLRTWGWTRPLVVCPFVEAPCVLSLDGRRL
ncbi:MAG: hypothetical protein R3A10_18880 [Caldilineaceae bacterium]